VVLEGHQDMTLQTRDFGISFCHDSAKAQTPFMLNYLRILLQTNASNRNLRRHPEDSGHRTPGEEVQHRLHRLLGHSEARDEWEEIPVSVPTG